MSYVPQPYFLNHLENETVGRLRCETGLSVTRANKTGSSFDWFCYEVTFTLPIGLSLITGGMGQGKTTFLLSLFRDVVERYPDNHHYFLSYEERDELTALKIISGWSREKDLNLIKNAVSENSKGKRGGILEDHPKLKSAIEKFQTFTDTEALIIEHQKRIDWTVDADPMGPPKLKLARMIMELGKNGDTGVVFIDGIEEAAMLQEVAQDRRMIIVATTKDRSLVEDADLALDLKRPDPDVRRGEQLVASVLKRRNGQDRGNTFDWKILKDIFLVENADPIQGNETKPPPEGLGPCW